MQENASARVDVLKLDLSSLKSVAAFADTFNSLNLPLNILINNAGIMFCPYNLSEDGIEMQFATNHLGHFLLTNLLLDKMKSTARATGIEGRIVNLSSMAHIDTYKEGIHVDKLNDRARYSDKRAYGQSKLANILHTNELARRLKEEGAYVTANSVHPGLIMTNLMRHSIVLMRFLKAFSYIFWKNVPQEVAAMDPLRQLAVAAPSPLYLAVALTAGALFSLGTSHFNSRSIELWRSRFQGLVIWDLCPFNAKLLLLLYPRQVMYYLPSSLVSTLSRSA